MNTVTESRGSLSVEALRGIVAHKILGGALEARPAPLSFAQQRLWFLDQLEPNSPRYNMPSVPRLRGPLNVPALEQAIQAIISRQEALRTRFICMDGEPAQVVDEAAPFCLPIKDLSGPSESEQGTRMGRIIQQESTRPFNLGVGRLFRAQLVRLAPDDHVLIINMHHIVSDEWSFRLFYQELRFFYSGFAEGRQVSLPELPIQYSDYAQWQRDLLQGTVLEEHLAFWKEHLAGSPAAVELATDHPRGATAGGRGGAVWRLIDLDMLNRLKELARQHRATLFMVLLAALKILLFRYTQQRDIIVGTPVAGRNRVETEELIGFFINTLPLRSRLSGELNFEQTLKEVKKAALDAFSHQEMPFEKLVEALQPERSANQTPFVSVMFHVQPVAGERFDLPGLQVEFIGGETETAKFDLTLSIQVADSGMVAGAQYDAELFEASTIHRLLKHYEILLQGILLNPQRRISALPLLSEPERQQLLVDWNNTATSYPRQKSVHALFEEQAMANPHAVAIVCGEIQATYQELDVRSNQLARYLKRTGVLPGAVVGICLERSVELIVGLLGILKAGAAYVSLEPSTPRQRLVNILQDLRPSVILTEPEVGGGIADLSFPEGSSIRRQEFDWKRIAQESPRNLGLQVDPESLAYISFTSGSTGRPKGVCVPHRAVVRLVRDTNFARFSCEEVFLQMASIAFDASTFEVWGALLNGGKLVVVPPQVPSLSEVAETIQKHQVTTAWFTSGLFNQIVDEKPEVLGSLRQILTGGDVLSPAHVKKALSLAGGHCRIINGYGPTENTTFTACYSIPPSYEGAQPVPIGHPVSNTTCFILDQELQPVPIGVVGELYTGGDGLATGYWNAPDLTAERFVPNPYDPGSRIYKTGDRARYRPDGTIEFFGRCDLQVKIRGFRVELGEIETTLGEHPGVRQCVVVARADASGAKHLVGYVVPTQFPAPKATEVQEYLKERLPNYMVPAFIVDLPSLPLTANGKVDRAALPAPEVGQVDRTEFSAPTNETERQLQEVWEQVLNIRPIGIRDRFFALGGHSLLAVRLLARVEKVFAQKLPVATLFQNPTIEQLAKLLKHQSKLETPASSIVEIQPHGSRRPLFLVHGVGGGMFWGYSNLARHLGNDQPIYAFKSRGLGGQPEFETVEEMAESYLADLRRLQPSGPYCLGGYCFGGVVAYEMACRLRSQGEEIPVLVLINSNPPNSSYTHFQWSFPTARKWAINIGRRTLVSLHSRPGRLCSHLCWRTRGLVKRIISSPGEPAWNIDHYLDLSAYTEEQKGVWATHARALTKYLPGIYRGDITLFRSPMHLMFCSFEKDYGWGSIVQGGVTVKIIPGMHETIMEEPKVRRLAKEIASCLSKFPS